MLLSSHIDALNNNTFDPECINDLQCYAALYKGKTLLQHIATKPHYLELMNRAILRLAILALDAQQPSGSQEQAFRIFFLNLRDMCQTMAYRETTMVLRLWAGDPAEYFLFLKRKKPTQYASPDFYKIVPIIRGFLHEHALQGQLARLVAGANSLQALKLIKDAWIGLTNDRLFMSQRNLILKYADRLDSIDRPALRELTEIEQRDYFTFLAEIHKQANEHLKPAIVEMVKDLITDHAQDPTSLPRDLPAIFIQCSPELLSALPRPCARILLFRGALAFSNEEKKYYQIMCDSIQEVKESSPRLRLVFDFAGATQQAQKALIGLLALAKFPEVSELCFPMNHAFIMDDLSEVKYFSQMIKCERVLLTCVSHPQNGGHANLSQCLQLLTVFAPNASRVGIDFSALTHYFDTHGRDTSVTFINDAIRHGIERIHFRSLAVDNDGLSQRLSYVDTIDALPETGMIYHEVTLTTPGGIMDLVIEHKGLRPGPKTLQSLAVKNVYQQIFPSGQTGAPSTQSLVVKHEWSPRSADSAGSISPTPSLSPQSGHP